MSLVLTLNGFFCYRWRNLIQKQKNENLEGEFIIQEAIIKSCLLWEFLIFYWNRKPSHFSTVAIVLGENALLKAFTLTYITSCYPECEYSSLCFCTAKVSTIFSIFTTFIARQLFYCSLTSGLEEFCPLWPPARNITIFTHSALSNSFRKSWLRTIKFSLYGTTFLRLAHNDCFSAIYVLKLSKAYSKPIKTRSQG